jgi:parallel beta-helix repeat protein
MRPLVLLLALVMTACERQSPTSSDSSPGRGRLSDITVGPNQAFTSIQPALDAAPSGATVTVLAGSFSERIIISKRVKLHGRQAILDGLSGGLDGRFVGIEVKADDVEITGFTVQNYERGIVVDRASNFRLRDTEVRFNLSKDPPPISAGVTKSDGVVLITVQNSEIADSFIHDNGSIGLWLSRGSSGNTVRGNRFVNNGTQQGLPGSGYYGVGIFTSGLNNTRNEIVDNEVSGGYWGINIGGSPDSANLVRNNRVRDNYRAGIAVFGQLNTIEGNVVRGNGSANMPPSCRLDLMDFGDLNNTWRDNTGTVGSDAPIPNPTLPFVCSEH